MERTADQQIVDEKIAAEILDVAVQTVRNWRHVRKGPAWIKMHKSVRYKVSDLYDFINRFRIDPSN